MELGFSRTTGPFLALLAALSWGGGDFSGGMGSKAAGGSMRGTLRVLITAHALSLAVLVACLLLRSEWVFHRRPIFWGLSSGVVAGLSISAFYLSLARGAMGASAAVSGLLAAAIPAAAGIAMEGRPSWLCLFGFTLAGIAIWLIAATPSEHTPRDAGRFSSKSLALAGGVGFGLYFLGLKLANGVGVLEPVALARTGSVLTCVLLYLLVVHRTEAPREDDHWLSPAGWGWTCGVAVLDTGGNLLYLASTRAGRLDVAAVLASLYPASTILLAARVLGERLAVRQMIGMGVAATAAVLVTL